MFVQKANRLYTNKGVLYRHKQKQPSKPKALINLKQYTFEDEPTTRLTIVSEDSLEVA